MKKVKIKIPQLAMIAGTRVLLGSGLGLLLADRLEKKQRTCTGWTLLGVGIASTIPLGMMVLCKKSRFSRFLQYRPKFDFLKVAGL
ncbi:hypothetical protein [Geobacter sp. SVR]|uniref:hypothetical protein n=1 Tax=Geobacter sp. SVR TaxID=2495594 RepID=UPI00143F0447|nr:hypothetical protein [Geobacter sp. SVR]BCS54030.1 hypothetical protein GSVR_23380 [Geobacter sp. SVR]GCF86189.1 hypothetical protein GSbR_27890 [Geobacter sp. SVR]